MPQPVFQTEDYALATWLVFNRVTLIGCVAYPGDVKSKFIFLEPVDDFVEQFSTPRSDEARLFKRFFTAHTIVKKSLKESYDSRALFTNK